MKVIKALFLGCALSFFVLPAQAADAKYASMVIEAETGRVLHATNEDTRNYPASLTKIMTLYMVFDALRAGKVTLETPLKVSAYAASMQPSKLGLRPGQTIKMKDAILALVTKSANDVAVTVAEGIGGTEANFAEMMTKRARQLGMSRTTFKNASGLPNRRQLSTARDMAMLGLRIRQDYPNEYAYFSTTHFKHSGRTYKNHNSLLSSYEGTDGIKTGYIRASGFNLVASVMRNDRRLIGVVFGGKSGPSRDAHMKKLLDAAFAKLNTEPAPRTDLVAVNASIGEEESVEMEQMPQGDAAAGLDLSEMQATLWTIQVGAFSKQEAARTVAQQAVSKLGALGDSVVIVVDKSGKFNRSRIAGFDKKGAFNACRTLKAKKMDCIVFAPQG